MTPVDHDEVRGQIETAVASIQRTNERVFRERPHRSKLTRKEINQRKQRVLEKASRLPSGPI